ncbi:MAG: hypothetical protein HQL31_03190, partial [Planctomycetes bacterium]|nr:hypothetical protein [Planctomycetota bacterium]
MTTIVEDPKMEGLRQLYRRFLREQSDFLDTDPTELVTQTEQAVATLLPDGSWNDVDYGPGELLVWPAMTHLKRLHLMSQAWLLPKAATSGRANLMKGILAGLAAWFDRDPLNPNWWHNEIGAPALLGEILLIVKEHCPAELATRAVPAFERHHPALRYTGQNLVWVSAIKVRHGLIVDNPGLVSEGFLLITRDLRVAPLEEEGIKPDMSFHQHGVLLYSGGYGRDFDHDMARFAWLAHDTSFAWPRHLLALLSCFILDGSRWFVQGDIFDFGAVGRQISRAGDDAGKLIKAAAYMAEVDKERGGEYRSLLFASARGASSVLGNRLFSCSDIMTHHTEGGYVSARVTSNRILNADLACCGGEGRLCHHMADGATCIMVDGGEYRDLFPVWDWKRIPGTTVEQNGNFVESTLRHFGKQPFAGGVSDGRVGCLSMDFQWHTLQARKAWFFLPQGVVALGAGIHSNSRTPVHTTINQCHLRGKVWLQGETEALEPGLHPLRAGSTLWHD